MIKKFILVFFGLAFISLAAGPGVSAAVDPFKDICKNPSAKNSSACKDKNAGQKNNTLYGPDGILTIIARLVSLVVGIAAVVTIIFAGLKYITSGSNAQDVGQARELAIYAIVGLVIAASAQILVQFVLTKL